MQRLVVIDDEYIVVEGIKAMIARQKMGYEVVGWAYDGIRGLEVVRELKPDLVITDIRIPGLDGLSLVEVAKEECPDTVFIVISGYTEFEYARRALALGVRGYIDKPISMAKLQEVFNRVEKEAQKSKSEEKEDIQQEYEQIEESLNKSIGDIVKGEPQNLHEHTNNGMQKIRELYPQFEEQKRECYKFLCVLSDILAEQKSGVRRSDLVSYQELENKNTGKEVWKYAENIISLMVQYLESDKTGSNHRIVLKLLDYIQQYYSEDIGLNELADMVKMNPAYLSALFKDEVGMSYIKYLTEFRLNKAKHFLQEGYKVSTVSGMVGYNNYRYFCDIFKKHFGQTPNEYKGSSRKKE